MGTYFRASIFLLSKCLTACAAGKFTATTAAMTSAKPANIPLVMAEDVSRTFHSHTVCIF
jgi:hypothetical protein